MSTRLIHVGRKMRFYPTRTQEKLLRQDLGCARFVYNWFLEQRSTAYKETGKNVSFKACCQQLTQLKQQDEYAFLQQASSTVLQQSLRNLDSSFTGFFKGVSKYPQFHSKHKKNSITFTSGAFTLNGRALSLQKIPGHLQVVWSYTLPQSFTPSKVTVSLEPDGAWYVSIQGTQTVETLPKIDKSVGIDVGIRSYAIFDNGIKIPNPRFIKQCEQKLTQLHQQLSRRKKGGVNYKKTQKQLARLYAHIRHQRLDFIHKLTTQIVRENQTMICETLDIKALMKRLEPIQDEQGIYAKNGQNQHSTLTKSIQDASWYEFFRQLAYKSTGMVETLFKHHKTFPARKCARLV